MEQRFKFNILRTRNIQNVCRYQSNSYYVATYTISATDHIVSLTNLKVTGNYEFVLIEDIDVEIDGSVGEGDESGTDTETDGNTNVDAQG